MTENQTTTTETDAATGLPIVHTNEPAPDLGGLTDAQIQDAGAAVDAAGGFTFTPGYDELEGLRVYRRRIHVKADGTAAVTFRGQVASGLDCWVATDRKGNLQLFAEVATDETTATRIELAVIPTGAQPPTNDGDAPTYRIGSERGKHVYLLSVDGTVDRAAYDERQAAKAEQRRQDREDRAAIFSAFDGD